MLSYSKDYWCWRYDSVAALAEDLRLVPSTTWWLTTAYNSVPGHPTPSGLLGDKACMWYTFIRRGNHHTHKTKIKSLKQRQQKVQTSYTGECFSPGWEVSFQLWASQSPSVTVSAESSSHSRPRIWISRFLPIVLHYSQTLCNCPALHVSLSLFWSFLIPPDLPVPRK
jgi:hypothetical protein